MTAGWQKNPLIVIDYNFDLPQSMTAKEEYYTMPTLSMIGSIGGTLGMLIEFSIFGAVIEMAELLLLLLKKCVTKGKYVN